MDWHDYQDGYNDGYEDGCAADSMLVQKLRQDAKALEEENQRLKQLMRQASSELVKIRKLIDTL